MVGKKISDFESDNKITGTELIYAVDDNTDVKLSTQQIKDFAIAELALSKADKSEIIQGQYEFGTYAEFDAYKSNLPVNCTVVIGEENNTGIGTWGIGNNRWNGTTLSKSDFNPVEQAKFEIIQQAGLLSNLPLVDRSFTANGATVSGAVLTIPNGQNGRTSYIMKLIEFHNSSAIASKKIKIVAQFKKSANFAASGTTLVHNILARVDGVSKADQQVPSSFVITNIDSTTVEVSAEYIVEAATSLQVGITAIVGASRPTASETVTVEALANVKLFSDSATMSEIGDMYNKLRIDANTTDINILKAKESVVTSSLSLTTRTVALNDATAVGAVLTIPSGKTGSASYTSKLIDFSNTTDISGKTVKVTAHFKKSANFSASGVALIYSLLARVNDVNKGWQQVPNSLIIEDVDAVTVKVSAEYVVESAASVQVGIVAQVGSSSPSASAPATVEALSNVSLSSDTSVVSAISSVLNKKATEQNKIEIESVASDLKKTAEIELETSNFVDDLRNLNGATLITKGLKFPVGQTGLTSFIRLKVFANLLKDYSFTAKLSAVVTTSDDFFEKFGTTKISVAKYELATGSITINEGSNTSELKKIDKNKYVVSATFDSNPGFEAYALWFQLLGSADTSIERTMQYEKVYLQILSVNSADYVAQNTLAAQYKADTLRAMIPTDINVIQFYRPQYTKIVKVKADGTGDFNTIEAAFAANGGGTDFYNRVKYEIYEGNYTPLNQYIPKYADLIGVGKRDNIHIYCHLPDNTAPTIIENSQPLWMNETSKIRGLKITAKNARYPLHSDSMNSDKKAVQEAEDCWIEHLGNDGARAWQAANGGNPSLVRTQHYALGCGSHADFMFFSRRTVWKSSNRPFYVHNQREFASPAYVEIDGGAVICTSNDSDAILFMSLGSGQVCNVVIKNNPTVRGRLTVTASNSLSTVVDNQIADRNGEWAVEINGGSIPFYMEDYDQCLTLKSVAGANSSVRVSGTAADAIFGKYPDYQDGATNLVGLVHSRFAATATNPSVTANIGTRLGDCTTTAKTLNIVFDGSISKTITLNANYTAMSNNDIVSALNTALADANRSFTITSSPYTNKAHVKQTAHEAMILNTSSIAILKGAAVKQSTNMNCGEMANDDAGFIGIALENILPNQIGRVQKSGYICKRMIWTGHTFVVGDFGTVNTTGSILKSTTSGVLKCVDVIAGEPVFEIK